MEFKAVSLDELVDFYVDNRGKTCPTTDKENEYLPLIATNCITDRLYPVFSKVRSVDKETYSNWFRSHPQPGDIIFVNKGTPGKVAMVPNKVNFCIAQDMVALRIKPKFYNYYIYAVLNDPNVKMQIDNMQVGTLIPHFKKTDFKNLKLNIFEDYENQKKIGDFYMNLCKKIEVNYSIINKLEQLSTTLFKRWFIDFEFPNELGQPYKSSGGEMVESELREIPITFNTGTIKNFCELKYGKALTKKNRIPGSYPVYGSGGITGTHKEYLIKGPGLIIGRKGSIGTLYLEANNFYPIDTVYYVESKTYPINFLHQFFKQYDFTQANNDSAVPGLNREFVYNTKAIIPDFILVQKFEKILNPMYEKINNLLKENQQLSELRDTLLPKLLSGEIGIPDELVVD
ncbi:restriction endonuclease subunit S [Bacillus toyonensis]|uniref:restriction endonuclease subunit S n=1 Tax=Bacillus toyonensis TaxID=155322 RepID=UPI003018A694